MSNHVVPEKSPNSTDKTSGLCTFRKVFKGSPEAECFNPVFCHVWQQQ